MYPNMTGLNHLKLDYGLFSSCKIKASIPWELVKDLPKESYLFFSGLRDLFNCISMPMLASKLLSVTSTSSTRQSPHDSFLAFLTSPGFPTTIYFFVFYIMTKLSPSPTFCYLTISTILLGSSPFLSMPLYFRFF